MTTVENGHDINIYPLSGMPILKMETILVYFYFTKHLQCAIHRRWQCLDSRWRAVHCRHQIQIQYGLHPDTVSSCQDVCHQRHRRWVHWEWKYESLWISHHWRRKETVQVTCTIWDKQNHTMNQFGLFLKDIPTDVKLRAFSKFEFLAYFHN